MDTTEHLSGKRDTWTIRESVTGSGDYIEPRLSEGAYPGGHSGQALFSPWQFHRIFTVMVGMPVMA